MNTGNINTDYILQTDDVKTINFNNQKITSMRNRNQWIINAHTEIKDEILSKEYLYFSYCATDINTIEPICKMTINNVTTGRYKLSFSRVSGILTDTYETDIFEDSTFVKKTATNMNLPICYVTIAIDNEDNIIYNEYKQRTQYINNSNAVSIISPLTDHDIKSDSLLSSYTINIGDAESAILYTNRFLSNYTSSIQFSTNNSNIIVNYYCIYNKDKNIDGVECRAVLGDFKLEYLTI